MQTPPSCAILIHWPWCMAMPNPSAPMTAPEWMRTRLPKCTRLTKVTCGISTLPSPTLQSLPITQCGWMMTWSPSCAFAPITANAPIRADGLMTALGSMLAEALIPSGKSSPSSNRPDISAKLVYGSALIRQAPTRFPASFSCRITTPALVSPSCAVYLLLARNANCPGPALCSVPMPSMVVSGSPR